MTRYDETWLPRWFGDGPLRDDTCFAVLSTLDDCMRRQFGTPLYKSPGLTGALAWRKSPMGRDWEPLPAELQTLIRDTSMQGRFECCPIVDPLPALYCLDLRLAYAAAAQALVGGKEWRHETRPKAGWNWGFLDYRPARYRVIFQAPEEWLHVGILPAWSVGARGWVWPGSKADWSSSWATWADAAEVRLAIAHGWQIEILERVYCADKTEHRPLRGWADRLLSLRDTLAQGSDHPALYRTAIRRMILQAIGIFAARPKTEVRTVGSVEELPTHELAEETFVEREDGSIEYEDYARNLGLAPLLHPEFASLIWGQTRAWLLEKQNRIGNPRHGEATQWVAGALTLPREQIVGFGLDAIWTTVDPQWPDDGREGRYRVKGHLPGPLPAPTNRRELELLGKQMSDGGT